MLSNKIEGMRNNFKLLSVLFFVSTNLAFIYAADKIPVDDSLGGVNSWQNEYTLTEDMKGKYNVVVKATDSAGNVTETEAFNIFIDLESDMPKVGVTNPSVDQIVQGNLNIVGTATDDDDVESVTLVFDGDTENSVKANGNRFWSYTLNTTALTEGVHTIEVYATDINGLDGHPTIVKWILDRRVPAVEVTNHSMGDIVHGKVTLEGTVTDGNGISFLEYSFDKGKTYQPVSIKKNASVSPFKISVDTRKINGGEDGPVICYFRATDSVGSRSSSVFFFYVDNSNPDVRVITPAFDESRNGIFTVAGYAKDAVGLSSLSWKFAGKSGNIELIPGSNYWVVEMDARGLNGKQVFEITAVDSIENSVTVKHPIFIDSNADLPVTTITYVDRNFLRGYVTDDDGVSSVSYKLDKDEEVTVDVQGAFCIKFDKDFEPGTHTVSVTASDIYGIRGKTVNANFNVEKPFVPKVYDNYPPEFGLMEPEITRAGKDTYKIKGQISDDGGLDNLELFYSIDNSYQNWLPFEFDAAGNFELTVDIADKTITADGVPVDFVLLTIKAKEKDTYGDQLINAKTKEPIFELSDPEDPESELVPVLAVIEGQASYMYCALSTRSEIPSMSSVTAKPQNQAPVITITNPEPGFWIKDKFTVTGNVSDDKGLSNIDFVYCVDDKLESWLPLATDASGNFSIDVDVSDNSIYPDGYIPFTVKAVEHDITALLLDSKTNKPLIDAKTKQPSFTSEVIKGQVTTYCAAVNKDNTAPSVRRILPEPGRVVNGKFFIMFDVRDFNSIKKIEYTSAKGNKVELDTHLSELINPYILIGTDKYPFDKAMQFSFTDYNDNVATVSSWNDILYDVQSDIPSLTFNVPEDYQIITTDFTVSGVATDDDGDCYIYYSIDGGEYKLYSEVPSSSYRFDLPLTLFTDNEHTISVYAQDINGLKGPEETRTIRVSLEEPVGEMTAPDINISVRDDVTIKGVASDKNGIKLVQISLDNGITYNNATGTTAWSYTFDSNLIQDGTHAVFIKIFDNYDIETMISSMVTIDNNAPVLSLDYPIDGQTVTRQVNIVGRITDTIGLAEAYITFKSLSGHTVPSDFSRVVLNPDDTIVSRTFDVTTLADGDYNIEMVAIDRAGNVGKISRNFTMERNAIVSKVSVLFPMPNSFINHKFNIYGTAIYQDENVAAVELYIDGKLCSTVERTTPIADGFYKLNVDGDLVGLTDGLHSFRVVEISETGKTVSSEDIPFNYGTTGPWVTLDNFIYGDFAVDRPFLRGQAGYALSEEEKLDKKLVAAKKVSKVYVSLDNGKTFVLAGSGSSGKFKYRVENLDIPAGCHYVLVKAVMADGSESITRMLFQVDREAPQVEVITPVEGEHYNQTLSYSGIASDNVNLENIELLLRKGDKNSYALPGFIQGLYIDSSFWGASLYSVGAGLTAFDGAVKIQGQFGQFTRSQWEAVSVVFGLPVNSFRFGGNIVGGKIIAQLADLPFMYFWGRDFEWLSATAAIGANFSYFTETGAGGGQMLSAIIGQVEFPKITLKNNKAFKTWAVYYEPQVWVTPSDAANAAKVVFTMSLGIRTSIF